MDFIQIRQNFDSTILRQITNSFTETLIWQARDLDHYAGNKLSYNAQGFVDKVCRTFYTFVLSDKDLTNELINFGGEDTGHNLCLQLLGHGSGFWDNENTKGLDQLTDLLKDKKVLPEHFTLFYCDQWEYLDIDF